MVCRECAPRQNLTRKFTKRSAGLVPAAPAPPSPCSFIVKPVSTPAHPMHLLEGEIKSRDNLQMLPGYMIHTLSVTIVEEKLVTDDFSRGMSPPFPCTNTSREHYTWRLNACNAVLVTLPTVTDPVDPQLTDCPGDNIKRNLSIFLLQCQIPQYYNRYMNAIE